MMPFDEKLFVEIWFPFAKFINQQKHSDYIPISWGCFKLIFHEQFSSQRGRWLNEHIKSILMKAICINTPCDFSEKKKQSTSTQLQNDWYCTSACEFPEILKLLRRKMHRIASLVQCKADLNRWKQFVISSFVIIRLRQRMPQYLKWPGILWKYFASTIQKSVHFRSLNYNKFIAVIHLVCIESNGIVHVYIEFWQKVSHDKYHVSA